MRYPSDGPWSGNVKLYEVDCHKLGEVRFDIVMIGFINYLKGPL